ncbi:MAG: YhbY family RNA-binding protein [Promethearchaeota archaeon]
MEIYKEVLQTPEILRIGKNLVSEAMIKQIKNVIKQRSIIKIKILKNALSSTTKEEIIKQVLLTTETFLLDIRGNSFIISKKRYRDLKISKKCIEIMRQVKLLKNKSDI